MIAVIPGELWLCARTPDGRSRSLTIRIAPDRPAAELLEHLAVHLGLQAPALRLVIGDRSAPVGPGRDVASLGLRMGDELLLVSGAGPPAAPAAPASGGCPLELAVVGGPLAGSRFPLRDGEQTLGRGGDADIRLRDPSVSRRHLHIRVGDGTVRLTDAGSRLGTHVDGRPIHPGRPIGPGDVFEAGRSLLAVLPSGPSSGSPPRARSGRVGFNRPPAVPPAARRLDFRLPAAPAEPHRLRVPLAASLMPLLLGLALWPLARNAMALLLALATPLMALAPALEERLLGRRHQRRDVRGFREELVRARQGLRALLAEEALSLRSQAPDACDLERRARRVLPALWERRPCRPDFLRLRVGWGDVASAVRVELPDGGQAALRAEAADLAAACARVAAAPVTVDLAELGGLGLAGPPDAVAGLARWLVIQAAALHDPHDLAVAAFLPEPAGDWEWLRWLPHTHVAGLGGGAMVARRAEAQRRLARSLVELLTASRVQRPPGDRSARRRAAVLVLAHEGAPVERAALAELLHEGAAGDLFVLWVGSDRDLLPDGCPAVVELAASGAELHVRRPGAGEAPAGIPDLVSREYADRVARALSGIETSGPQPAGGSIPSAAGLLDCLGGGDEVCDGVVRRWSRSSSGLAAPVGVGAGGIVTLDLREQGPHALVGGTSGAGKSEFLRAWVTSLAATYSPRRLNFLLVDFKGGTAFQDCARLPHVVGLLTDLSERLVRRARLSLLAEMKRREAELARAGEKEFVDFERCHPESAFPALIVVFDEFEQLLAEHPGFVSEVVVPIARVGRGLGVHLVLGTQRPQGSVPEAIRSNTNIRVALRMLSEAQSQDVIADPAAARIPPAARGRAYLRLSHADLSPVQLAYAGARSGDGARAGQPVVTDLTFEDEEEGPGTAAGPAGPSDFERLSDAMRTAASRLGVPAVRRPWLPPLPATLRLSELPPPGGAPAAPPWSPIGLVDEPRSQSQWTAVYSLPRDGHLLVYGAARSGKSTLLRAIACGLAEAHPPQEVRIYGLDFSGGALQALEGLPHVGCVAAADDPERVAQLLRILAAEVAARRRQASASSILLLVDEYATFKAVFERFEGGRYVDLLDTLVRDGREAGVHCVLATSQRRDLFGLVSSAIGRRLVLRPDRQDQEALGLGRDVQAGADLPAGRGFLDAGLEIQVAVLADGSRGSEAAAIRRLASRLARRHGGRTAPRVDVLPEDLRHSTLPAPSGPMRAVIGLGGDTVAPLEVDLSHAHLVVSGPRGSGRTTTLATLAASLTRTPGRPALVLLATRRRSELAAGIPWSRAAVGGAGCQELIEELSRAAEADLERPTVVVIDDAEPLTEGAFDAAMRELMRRARDLPLRVVASLESRTARRYSEWLGELRECRQAVLLSPYASGDGEPYGAGALPTPLRLPPPGRGCLVSGGRVTSLQVAR